MTTTQTSRETARFLRIYLADHDGASVGGLRLFERVRDSNEDSIFGPTLAALADEIRDDRDELARVMQVLHVRPSTVKRVGARCATALGRITLNGRVVTYSPLSRVLELEAMSAAVTAKLRLWSALSDVAATDRRVDAAAMAILQNRARTQLDLLANLHRTAADLAFCDA